jgi:MurE/MurF fusion protein
MIKSILIDNKISGENLIALLRNKVECGAHLSTDSRSIKHGDVFVACPGLSVDGRDFIESAINLGASVVLVHVASPDEFTSISYAVDVLAVVDLAARLGELADLWYERPSASMKVLAVTGTNGKTSCVDWLSQALRQNHYKVGVIGTLGVTYPDGKTLAGHLTTPDVISVHRTLASLREAGADYVAMEASSIGLDQGRLSGVRIHAAGFTNLSRDHLDYHGTMQAYEAAKGRLFAWPDLQYAVLNLDDPVGVRLSQKLSCRVLTYSISKQVDSAALTASKLQTTEQGIEFSLNDSEQQLRTQTQSLGSHNISNLLCVAGLLKTLGWDLNKISQALAKLGPVDGRLERVTPLLSDASVPRVVVDYAHTPDALERVLRTLRPLAQARGGRLWCVFGCGGDRDAGKRSIMGAVAHKLADSVIVTSDNPRSEDPLAIIASVIAGIPGEALNVSVIEDRAQAIVYATLSAAISDVILIAGKGHETYQEIKGVRHAFDDRQWAQAAYVLKQERPIQTDSRQLQKGAIFVALRGEKFDGHDYLQQVEQDGASVAIVEQRQPAVSLPQVVLGDTRAALLTLGRAWRKQFNIPVIAVTGSNGKTTTKEMIASILAVWLGESGRMATIGNLNNELGVPLTLLRMRSTHRAAVIELGMNHPGEIAVLADVARPTVALVNNAQREHQEFMETVEAVAIENAAVFDFLVEGGVKVFPADEEFSQLWQRLAGSHPSLRFGMESAAEVWAEDMHADALGSSFVLHLPVGQSQISLPVPGIHNIRNALAAAACAHAAGAPLSAIVQGLESFQAVAGRMQTYRLLKHHVLIDDTYNANPDSVRAAIDVLAGLPGPRALVLGDMGEVGDNGPAMHREVGAYAKARGIEYLLTMGLAARASAEAFGADAVVSDIPEELCATLRELPAKSVLVKGSRFMRMERIVKDYLKTTGINPEDVVSHAV